MHNLQAHNQNPVVEAIKKVKDAVVSVSVTKELPDEILKNIPPVTQDGVPPVKIPKQIQDKLPHEHDRMQVGGGSGFIASSDGLIVTNKHVLREETATYSVVLADDKILPAKILSRDPVNDIALLKISVEGPLPTIQLGDSTGLELGETVIAIGNALGTFANTVSVGVVSGLTRSLSAQDGVGGGYSHLRGLIQTDAAINPGNSGGPLVNVDGKAIGVNVATVMGAENIGFAIPINSAKRDLEDLFRYGRIRRPFLGVRYLIVDKKLKDQLGLPTEKGAYVANENTPEEPAIVPASPAAKAGLKEKDIILSFNGTELDQKTTLQEALENCKVGQAASIVFLRDGNEYETTIKLSERSEA